MKYIFTILITIILTAEAYPQQSTYKLSPYPDVWYNSVDGTRIGIRILGEYDGSFKSGKHRLDAGFWGATKIPDNPFSYYVKFTEPLSDPDDPYNELNISVNSSIRTGFSRHGLTFSKRHQRGFDELDYSRLSLGFNQERLFDRDYILFDQLWQTGWKSILNLNFLHSTNYSRGVQSIQTEFKYNASDETRSFYKFTVDASRIIQISNGFKAAIRTYAGRSSKDILPEFSFGFNFEDMTSWMDNGFMRARGTVPPAMIENGNFQYSSGPNLRGYSGLEFSSLFDGTQRIIYSVVAFNLELDYPNFVNNLWKDSIVDDLINFRSYTFADAGFISSEINNGGTIVSESGKLYADGGLGFQLSVNIPDFLGNDRAIALRYDIPFWVSEPQFGEDPIRFRSLIGIGTVIDL